MSRQNHNDIGGQVVRAMVMEFFAASRAAFVRFQEAFEKLALTAMRAAAGKSTGQILKKGCFAHAWYLAPLYIKTQ